MKKWNKVCFFQIWMSEKLARYIDYPDQYDAVQTFQSAIRETLQ